MCAETLNTTDNGEAETCQTNSFLPIPQGIQTEEDGIRQSIDGTNVLDWPELGQRGINEFSTEGLATQAFPTLFPFSRGDPTSKQRYNTVTLSDAFKHLICYCDKSPDGSNRWRFAFHPRFPYWALNMKHRHQLLSQSSIFLKQNPTDAHLTIEQLRDMVGRFDSTNLITRIQLSKLQGSKQYWHARYEDLKALFQQKGSPTFVLDS